MIVQEVMENKPEFLNAQACIMDAVQRMQLHNYGFEPVAEGDKLVGVVTDRDIILRGLAEGKRPEDVISTVMSNKALYCFQNDDIKEVLKNMSEQNVQRLVVLDNSDSKSLVGVVALSDIAKHCNDDDLAMDIVNCCKRYH